MTRTVSQRKRQITYLRVQEGRNWYLIGLPDNGIQLKALLFDKAPRNLKDNQRGLLLNHLELHSLCL